MKIKFFINTSMILMELGGIYIGTDGLTILFFKNKKLRLKRSFNNYYNQWKKYSRARELSSIKTRLYAYNF